MALEENALDIEEMGPDEDGMEAASEDFIYNEDDLNLVPAFMDHPEGIEHLREIADRVYEDYQTAWDSCEQYRERTAADWKLFTGDLPAKDYPYENSANPHVPIMLENITRLCARASSELFGDYTNVFGVMPLGPQDEETAEVLSKHGNWQIREEIPDFVRQMDRAILSFFAWGDVTIHSFYDREREQNRHEVLTPDDFFVSNVHVTVMPDYSDVPYYGQILRYFRHDVEAMRDDWHDVDELLDGQPPSWSSDPDSPLKTSVDETNEIDEPDGDSRSPYKLIDYEGWLLLPNQARERWVKVVMDTQTKRVMLMRFHEEPDWRDQARYDTEMMELQTFRQSQAAYDMAMDAAVTNEDAVRTEMVHSDLPAEARQATIAAMQGQPLPQAPVPPAWLEDPGDLSAAPEPVAKVPIRMFTHAVCIENMVGALGLSFGQMQADFNRAANTMLSQLIDAETLANCSVLLTTDLVEFKRPMRWQPGSINKVTGISGQELKSNIMELQMGSGSGRLMEAVDKIVQWGQSAIQAPAVLSGEPGKSGETYRGIATRIEQATKQLSVSTRKFAMTGLRQVLLNNGRLNAIYLPDRQLFPFVDNTMQTITPIPIGRHMYQRDYRISIRADMRFASQAQRVQEAQELIMLPQQVPPLQQNLGWWQKATEKLLRARGDEDMIPYLGQQVPPPQTPMGIQPQPPAPPPGAAPPQGPPPQGGPQQ